MKQEIDSILHNLKDARNRLSSALDTQQYFLTLVEVRAWMDELAQTLTVGELDEEKYAAAYNSIFSPKGVASEYDRVCNYLDTHTEGALYHRIF